MKEQPVLLELTSARFLAAFAVLLGHLQPFLKLSETTVTHFTGGFGVSFFFVLSGFILTYRYWDDFRGGVAWRDYRPYFVARVARVYPSYVFALLLITALYAYFDSVRPGLLEYPRNLWVSWFSNLFAIQTFAFGAITHQFWNGPGWSISTEFGFYAMCPFFLAFVARRCDGLGGLLAFFAGALAFGAAMQAATLYAVFEAGWNRELWLDLIASRNIFWRLPEFLAGMVAARLLYGGHLAALGSAAVRNAALVAGLAAVIALNGAPWPETDREIVTMRQFRMDLAYMVPFAVIVVALASGPTILSPIFRLRASVFLGEISYGVYIYHWIAFAILANLLHTREVTPEDGWIAIVALIAFSALCFVALERPARRWIRTAFQGPPRPGRAAE